MVFSLFTRMSRELEAQLRVYLDNWDYLDLPLADRVYLANNFPFRGLFQPLIDQLLNDMRRIEDEAMGLLQNAMRNDFQELETLFFLRDPAMGLPRGWSHNIVNNLDWNRFSAYMSYLHNGADRWLGQWGAEAPTQLGAGILGGEPVSTIVSRITGRNVQTPEGRASLGSKVWQGLSVNAKYAVIETANAARTEGYRQLNDDYDLGLKRVWVAHPESACPVCLRLHGTVVGIDEQFPWRKSDRVQPYQGVLYHPPRHPQCKCSVAPWKESWGRMGLTTLSPRNMHEQAMLQLRRRFPRGF
jgi:hypothetical protein